jgi:hypothetical protein
VSNQRYEQAVLNAVGKPNFNVQTDSEKALTVQIIELLDYASSTDRAERDLLESSKRMRDLFKADVERITEGYNPHGALSYSCADDVARHKTELIERAQALRVMIRIAFGAEAAKTFCAALEAMRAK